MSRNRQESDLVRQVREAFDTVILDDRFLSDEQWQLGLLDTLRKNLDKTGDAVDEAIRRSREGTPH